jgi:hypothetical protein
MSLTINEDDSRATVNARVNGHQQLTGLTVEAATAGSATTLASKWRSRALHPNFATAQHAVNGGDSKCERVFLSSPLASGQNRRLPLAESVVGPNYIGVSYRIFSS